MRLSVEGKDTGKLKQSQPVLWQKEARTFVLPQDSSVPHIQRRGNIT